MTAALGPDGGYDSEVAFFGLSGHRQTAAFGYQVGCKNPSTSEQKR